MMIQGGRLEIQEKGTVLLQIDLQGEEVSFIEAGNKAAEIFNKSLQVQVSMTVQNPRKHRTRKVHSHSMACFYSLPLRVPKEEQRRGRRPEVKATCRVGMQRLLRWKQQNLDKALCTLNNSVVVDCHRETNSTSM